MNWMEKLPERATKWQNPFVQQYLIEILFPIIGYFFFDWSLTIIAVFYLVDQIASEFSFNRRLYKINRSGNSPYKFVVLISVVFFLLIFFGELFVLKISFLSSRNIEAAQLYTEISTFAKEELWLLFPLVIFLYYFKDQFIFYMPRRYLQYDAKKSLIFHQLTNFISIGAIAIGVVIWGQTKIPDVVALIIFLVLKIGFDFTIVKWADRKSKL